MMLWNGSFNKGKERSAPGVKQEGEKNVCGMPIVQGMLVLLGKGAGREFRKRKHVKVRTSGMKHSES